MGASRRSRWSEFARGSVINGVIRASGRHRRARHQPPAAGRTRGMRASGGAGPRHCPPARRRRALARRRRHRRCSPSCSSQLRDSFGLPSVLLLFLLVVVVVAAVGGLWPALVAAVAGSCSSTGTSRRRSTRSRSSEGENLLALSVFLVVAAIVSGFVGARGPPNGRGRAARAEAEALARLAGLGTGRERRRQPRQASSASSGAAVLHREGERVADRGVRRPAAPPTTRNRRRRHDRPRRRACPRAGRAPSSERGRAHPRAFAEELTASVELRRPASRGRAAGALSAGQRAAGGASCPPSRTTSAPRSRPSRPPLRASCRRTSSGPPRPVTSS